MLRIWFSYRFYAKNYDKHLCDRLVLTYHNPLDCEQVLTEEYTVQVVDRAGLAELDLWIGARLDIL